MVKAEGEGGRTETICCRLLMEWYPGEDSAHQGMCLHMRLAQSWRGSALALALALALGVFSWAP